MRRKSTVQYIFFVLIVIVSILRSKHVRGKRILFIFLSRSTSTMLITSFLVLLLNLNAYMGHANPYYVHEINTKGPVDLPLKYVNYAVAKVHIDDDVAKAKAWLSILQEVIQGVYTEYSSGDNEPLPIDPDQIVSRRVFAMLGPFESHVVNFNESANSKCYDVGYRHPEPLSREDMIELRKHGLVHDRDQILLPSLVKSNNRLVTEGGNVVKGNMNAMKLSTEPTLLVVEDRSDIRLGIVVEPLKVGNLATFCQRINVFLSNKNINLQKLGQMQSLLVEMIINLNAVQHELSQLEIAAINDPNVESEYNGNLAYESYSLVQRFSKIFTPTELDIQRFNNLIELMTALLHDLTEVRSHLERRQIYFKNQLCQISVKNVQYIIRCKNINTETMDRISIVPIPFVYENEMYQLIHHTYEYTNDYCIVDGNYNLPTRQHRLYLQPECCNQLRLKLAPMACPLQLMKSKEMILDVGDYEILIPDIYGSRLHTNCQGDTATDKVYDNTAVQTECTVQLGNIRLTMTGSKLFRNLQEKFHSWTQSLSDREWSILLIALTFVLGSILQCSVCYCRYMKRKNHSSPAAEDSSSDDEERPSVSVALNTGSHRLNRLLSVRQEK